MDSRPELELSLQTLQLILNSRTGGNLYSTDPELYDTITSTIEQLEYRLSKLK